MDKRYLNRLLDELSNDQIQQTIKFVQQLEKDRIAKERMLLKRELTKFRNEVGIAPKVVKKVYKKGKRPRIKVVTSKEIIVNDSGLESFRRFAIEQGYFEG